MSDSEDFLFQINAEELYPEAGTSSTKPKKRKLSQRKKKKKKKMKKISPNYFIGFQVYDARICQRVANFQNKIIEKTPKLKKALIDVKTLHVTLAVTHLDNPKKVSELQEKLDDWSDKRMKYHFITPIHLRFKGIGTFNNGVLFAKIIQNDNHRRLCNVATGLTDLLSKSGFETEVKEKFIPHLTLLKLSRNFKLFKEKKCFLDVFEELSKSEYEFGSQTVRDIQLLSMTEEKDASGYYKCLWKRETSESPEIEIKDISCV